MRDDALSGWVASPPAAYTTTATQNCTVDMALQSFDKDVWILRYVKGFACIVFCYCNANSGTCEHLHTAEPFGYLCLCLSATIDRTRPTATCYFFFLFFFFYSSSFGSRSGYFPVSTKRHTLLRFHSSTVQYGTYTRASTCDWIPYPKYPQPPSTYLSK